MRVLFPGLFLALVALSGCMGQPAPAALPAVVEPVAVAVTVDEGPPPPPPGVAVSLPKKIRAELAKAVPRENAAAAVADGDEISLIRYLHRNVLLALDDLERDGGRHMTPALIQRVQTALRDLENHLNELNPPQSPPIEFSDHKH